LHLSLLRQLVDFFAALQRYFRILVRFALALLLKMPTIVTWQAVWQQYFGVDDRRRTRSGVLGDLRAWLRQ
jgi:hypothetical protein